MNEEWGVVSERVICDRRPWVLIREQDVMLPGGVLLHDYVLLDERDGCLIVAVTPDGQAIILEQYRHGRGEKEFGLPSGFLEAGDVDPLERAKQELLEETGYWSDDWQFLAHLFTNSNRGRQQFYFYLALDATKVATPAFESGESDITISLMPMQQLGEWLEKTNNNVGMAATTGILLALAAMQKRDRIT